MGNYTLQGVDTSFHSEGQGDLPWVSPDSLILGPDTCACLGVLRASSTLTLSRITSPSLPLITKSPEKPLAPGLGSSTCQTLRRAQGLPSFISVVRGFRARVLKPGVGHFGVPTATIKDVTLMRIRNLYEPQCPLT